MLEAVISPPPASPTVSSSATGAAAASAPAGRAGADFASLLLAARRANVAVTAGSLTLTPTFERPAAAGEDQRIDDHRSERPDDRQDEAAAPADPPAAVPASTVPLTAPASPSPPPPADPAAAVAAEPPAAPAPHGVAEPRAQATTTTPAPRTGGADDHATAAAPSKDTAAAPAAGTASGAPVAAAVDATAGTAPAGPDHPPVQVQITVAAGPTASATATDSAKTGTAKTGTAKGGTAATSPGQPSAAATATMAANVAGSSAGSGQGGSGQANSGESGSSQGSSGQGAFGQGSFVPTPSAAGAAGQTALAPAGPGQPSAAAGDEAAAPIAAPSSADAADGVVAGEVLLPAAGRLNKGAATNPASQPMPAAEQVKVQLTMAARAGKDQIAIELNPRDLGRVEIRLDVGRDGKVNALVLAADPTTLHALRNDARGIEQALTNAGLKADAGSLNFGMLDQQASGDRGGRPFPSAPVPASAADNNAALAPSPVTSPQSPHRPWIADGRRIDIEA